MLKRFCLFCSRFEEMILCLLLGGMVLLVCTQILLRDLLATGFMWIDSLLRYMVIWAGLLGAAVATKRGKHISIDIATRFIPARLKPWLLALHDLFAAAVCAVLSYAAVKFVQTEMAYGSRELLGIPAWGLNLIFPVAFTLIAIRFLSGCLKQVHGIITAADGK